MGRGGWEGGREEGKGGKGRVGRGKVGRGKVGREVELVQNARSVSYMTMLLRRGYDSSAVDHVLRLPGFLYTISNKKLEV